MRFSREKDCTYYTAIPFIPCDYNNVALFGFYFTFQEIYL